jgi:hypothetical protein
LRNNKWRGLGASGFLVGIDVLKINHRTVNLPVKQMLMQKRLTFKKEIKTKLALSRLVSLQETLYTDLTLLRKRAELLTEQIFFNFQQ